MMPPIYILFDRTYDLIRPFFDLKKAMEVGERMREGHGTWKRGHRKWTRGEYQEIREAVIE